MGAKPKQIKPNAFTAGGKSSVSLRMDDAPEPASAAPAKPVGGRSSLRFSETGEGFAEGVTADSPAPLKRYKNESQFNAVLAPPEPIKVQEYRTPAGGASTVDLTFGENEYEPPPRNPNRALPGGVVSVDLAWDENRPATPSEKPRYRKAVEQQAPEDVHKHRYKRHFEPKTQIQEALQHVDVDTELSRMQSRDAEVDVDAELATISHAVSKSGSDRMRHTWQDFTKFKTKSTLSQDDFAAGLRQMGVSLQPNQISNLYKRFSKGQDGQMTYSEFVRMATTASPSARGKENGHARSRSGSYSRNGSISSRRSSAPSAASSRSQSLSRTWAGNGRSKPINVRDPDREVSV